ncbi:hypothetical protein CDL15_Pgr015813 [Punica granatum]|uniref:Uncharacterized protein n=1 Tax=Punica granatum TaxID=22663 RepID=A0A218XP67_PUNGR|nr:hypothetical protein CDL15_Pgr015813 [Punica granatum]
MITTVIHCTASLPKPCDRQEEKVCQLGCSCSALLTTKAFFNSKLLWESVPRSRTQYLGLMV